MRAERVVPQRFARRPPGAAARGGPGLCAGWCCPGQRALVLLGLWEPSGTSTSKASSPFSTLCTTSCSLLLRLYKQILPSLQSPGSPGLRAANLRSGNTTAGFYFPFQTCRSNLHRLKPSGPFSAVLSCAGGGMLLGVGDLAALGHWKLCSSCCLQVGRKVHVLLSAFRLFAPLVLFKAL